MEDSEDTTGEVRLVAYAVYRHTRTDGAATIHLCDSDEPGAFPVYRLPVPQFTVNAECFVCGRTIYQKAGHIWAECIQDRNLQLLRQREDGFKIIERLRAELRESQQQHLITQAENIRLQDMLKQHNDACADALDKLWREVILSHRPQYGDWSYPGEAYRHLKAEFDDLRKESASSNGELKSRIECLSMFVRRLYRKLRKHEPNAEVIQQANTYLKSIGQAGTPLRAEECAPDGAK